MNVWGGKEMGKYQSEATAESIYRAGEQGSAGQSPIINYEGIASNQW